MDTIIVLFVCSVFGNAILFGMLLCSIHDNDKIKNRLNILTGNSTLSNQYCYVDKDQISKIGTIFKNDDVKYWRSLEGLVVPAVTDYSLTINFKDGGEKKINCSSYEQRDDIYDSLLYQMNSTKSNTKKQKTKSL